MAKQNLVLILCQCIAVLGVFPFGVLYGFPIAAALTLRHASGWLRICVAVVSGALFLFEALTEMGGR